MSTTMRAKMKVTSVKTNYGEIPGVINCEVLSFSAICRDFAKDGVYPADGSDENNTFARFTPQADCSITVTNQDLFGKITIGEKYYVDFTKVSE